jgi:hypothetical protein
MTGPPDSEDRPGHRARQPHDRGADNAQGTGRPPEYVVEAWVSEQLRARIQHNKTTSAEPLQEPKTHITHGQTRAPQADLEAEP